jgi:acetyltransferase
MNRYPVFGPLLMFGFGGIYVEVFQDVSFRLAPIGRNSARKMIESIKGYKLLQGFRDKPKRDIEHLEKLLISLSDLVINHPEITEMDINPLFVHEEEKGATVADLRILLTKNESA